MFILQSGLPETPPVPRTRTLNTPKEVSKIATVYIYIYMYET